MNVLLVSRLNISRTRKEAVVSFDNEEKEISIESLIGDICRYHHGQHREAFHSLGLHHGQHRLLFQLWKHEGLTQSELAAKMEIQPATLTRMVQRMERAGFLSRRADEHDERISRVYLTERARRIKTEVKDRRIRLSERAVKDFSPEEKEILTNLLIRLRENMIGKDR